MKEKRACLQALNQMPLTALCGSYCRMMDVPPPEYATDTAPELEKLLNKTASGKIDRALLYNPDAIGQWIYEKYAHKFTEAKAAVSLELPLVSMIPPKTPVCFASIYSGATPQAHGITKYEKPVVTIDTYFDALLRAGKKTCIVSVARQSMDLIFRGRDMDYFSEADDAAAVERALGLIRDDVYDVICVYNQDYDSRMHFSHPQATAALAALDAYNAAFIRLTDAVKSHWHAHDTLVGMATDHGVHRAWYGLGQHGKAIPKDLNVVHLYDVYPRMTTR